MKFSQKEIIDLVKAWIAVSLAFTLARLASSFLSEPFVPMLITFLIFLVINAVIVGLAFILHELAHKFVAQRYRTWAEFRSDDRMLLFMLVVSVFGFIFAAPGAVIIHGHLDYKRSGHISLAGPAMNIILAVICLLLTPVFFFASYGVVINAWLAVFNLLPFHPFDGAKVLAWNRFVWAGAGLSALALLFLTIL